MNSHGLKNFVASRRTALVCFLLAAATSIVYWQVSGFEFTNFDESKMVVSNPCVLSGLTLHGLYWALTTSWFEYWHPLTWLSHMLDCELFGLSPGWHHLVSLGFHIANTLLLFAVLQRMTRALWRSAMVAALFALHPLHVESVAWIAERKDVLSAFFFFLTLWAYLRYVEERTQNSVVPSHASRVTHHASIFYLLSLLFFACGLMSKPMLVTLPFVLLLLDYWPLGRMQNAECRMQNDGSRITHYGSRITDHASRITLLPLLVEKLPFFALTAASCAITYLGVRAGGNIVSSAEVPWGLRLANVPVAYVRYIGKMFWPTHLAALYPLPSHWAWWQVGSALMALAACSMLALTLVRRQPWLVVGWLWFLGTLVPVIGVLQVGYQAMADRYTYIPLVGLFIALVWGCFESLRGLRSPRTIAWAVPTVILLACMGGSWAQARYWRNSLALWARAVAVTSNNARAQHNYAFAFEQCGRLPEAAEHYEAALRIEPDTFQTHENLGCVLCQLGRFQEGTNQLIQALHISPGSGIAHANLGRMLATLGDWNAARDHYAKAMTAEPENPAIPASWGKVLLANHRATEALERFAQALQIDPNFPDALAGYRVALAQPNALGSAMDSPSSTLPLAPPAAQAQAQLGATLAAEGKLAEATQHYHEALRLQPDLPDVLNNLAWLLATANDPRLRNGAEAVRSAERACELTHHQQPLMVGTLAAAYAEVGRFEEARKAAEEAITLAEASGQTDLAARNRALLHLYETGMPCRQ